MSRAAVRRLTAAIALVALTGTGTACGSGRDSTPQLDAMTDAASWPMWTVEDPAALDVPPPPDDEAGAPEDQGVITSQVIARWGQSPAVWPWIELALEGVAARTKDPPAASRAYALVGVAAYDAVVAAAHWQEEYERATPSDDSVAVAPVSRYSYPSVHATIAGAVWPVLAHEFPEQPAARFERLANEAAASRVAAGVSRPGDVQAGLALGRQVAEAVIAHADSARPDEEWDGQRPTGPGYWEPPPGSVALPVTPLAGTWTPWVLESGDQFRPPPPPEYGSDQYMREAREVLEVSRGLTEEQKRIAEFWEGGEGTVLPPGIWVEALHAYVTNAGMSLPHAARAFALSSIALDDAGVSAWDAKYTWWTTRPVNAIRDFGLDEDWEPYLPTPIFPTYTSGHAVYSGAVSEVMAYLFPEHADEIRGRAQEAAVSRLYGGIHFVSDNDIGVEQGQQVGRYIIEQVEQREGRS